MILSGSVIKYSWLSIIGTLNGGKAIIRTKNNNYSRQKNLVYRIWFSIDFALMGKMKKLNLLNILTRVCMEFDFSSARVIESQLFILGNNWGLQAFPSPTLIMSNRCSIKFNKRFTLFFLFILPSDCQVTTISHFFVMFVQKQKFLWDSRRRMCVLLLQKISENEFSTYLLLITKDFWKWIFHLPPSNH